MQHLMEQQFSTLMLYVIHGCQDVSPTEQNVLIQLQLNVVHIRGHLINAKNSSLNLALQKHNHVVS